MRRAVARWCCRGCAGGADPRDLQGAASLEYEAGYLHAFDRGDVPAVHRLAFAGARLRGQMAAALASASGSTSAGATTPAVAYDCALYPLGPASGSGAGRARCDRRRRCRWRHHDGRRGDVPREAFLELALGSRLRLLARGRLTWLAGRPAGEDGDHGAFADELDASVSLRLGR